MPPTLASRLPAVFLKQQRLDLPAESRVRMCVHMCACVCICVHVCVFSIKACFILVSVKCSPGSRQLQARLHEQAAYSSSSRAISEVKVRARGFGCYQLWVLSRDSKTHHDYTILGRDGKHKTAR